MKCKYLGKDKLCLKNPFGNGGFEYCVEGPCDEVFSPSKPQEHKYCVQAAVHGIRTACIRKFKNGEGCKNCPDLREILRDLEKYNALKAIAPSPAHA